ncbi:c-type cytochrome [Myxococcota bacterium]|nr:c-type cytochrome [Myxococcota bacterium]
MSTLASLITLLALAAPPSAPDAAEGRVLFHDPGLGKNGVACATCHATTEKDENGDGLLRSGHTLWGAAKRKFWRGDEKRTTHPTLADAVDVCVQLFQGGQPLEGRTRLAIDAYLKSISKNAESPLVIEPALEADLDYGRDKYKGGDAELGRRVFFRACNTCHPKAGQGLGPAIAGKSVADVAKKIREGNGFIRGSRKGNEWMPFFGRDRLGDRQVADVAAYVASLKE